MNGREAIMPASMRQLPLLNVVIALVLVVASLYWARAVLISLALSILLTFLLDPLVNLLQRVGLGRIPSVILTVVMAFSLLGGIGWSTVMQMTHLASELPLYTDNLKRKVAELRGVGKGTVIERVQTVVEEVVGELEKSERRPKAGPPAQGKEKPMPVVVESPSVLWQLPSLLEPLANAGLVIVLVIFMLIRHPDLRNRLIRLFGYGRLTIATKALDEAGQRISRYLLMQSIVNGSFGTALGLGLFLIGVPYAILWGLLGAGLRFIPYVGTPVAAILPSALALTVFDGWMQLFLVLALFGVLELTANMIMEPWLYGQSAGVSEVALLVAVAFWTWLWGPVGLLLATPLTVCLGVLGRYVPQLEFLEILMSDEPALEPHTMYYQRLVAKDQDEAAEVVAAYVETHPLEELYDGVLIPALHLAKRDRAQDTLTEVDERFILRATRDIVEDLGQRYPLPSLGSADTWEAPIHEPGVAPPNIRILGCPAHGEADAVALMMLQQLLDPTKYDMRVASADLLTAELTALVKQQRPTLVCIGALAPGGRAQTRHLCKRLRTAFPELKIVIGRWGASTRSEGRQDFLTSTGSDDFGTTLLETRSQVVHNAQLLSPAEGHPSPESAQAPSLG